MPRKPQADPLQFEGFESPTTTPVPDVVFDRFLSKLGEAELKALLYIIRRTFGFKRNTDAISFNQFIRGITTRDGRVLDEGCGIRDRTSLSKALKSLEDKGIIKSDKGVDERGENTTTVYSLRFKGEILPGKEGEEPNKHNPEGVVGNSYHRSMNNTPPVVGHSYPQQTGKQKTVQQQSVVVAKSDDSQKSVDHSAESNNRNGESPGDSQVIEDLTVLGISAAVAKTLATRYQAERIRQKFDYLGYLQETNPKKVSNPRGWLRKAIENDYGPPDGYKSPEERAVEVAEEERQQQERAAWLMLQEQRPAAHTWAEQLVERLGVPESLQHLTRDLQDVLKQQMTAATFGTWASRIVITRVEQEQVNIAVPTQSAYEWLAHRLKPKFEAALTTILGEDVAVQFSVISAEQGSE